MKNLPCGQTQTFTVKLEPRGASLKMGNISVLMPIQVIHMGTHKYVHVQILSLFLCTFLILVDQHCDLIQGRILFGFTGHTWSNGPGADVCGGNCAGCYCFHRYTDI